MSLSFGLEDPSRGGHRIVRNAVALWLLVTVLLYWLGDFNAYADIDGRVYVVERPGLGRRLAYSAGLGLACGAAAAAGVRVAGRHELARFIALVGVLAAVLYVLADLNWYVVGFGPDGQDWVKNTSAWGAERLVECGVLAGAAGAVGCLVLRAVAPVQGSQLAEPHTAADRGPDSDPA